MKIIDYEIINTFSLIKTKKIFIYGIGNCGSAIYKCLEEIGCENVIGAVVSKLPQYEYVWNDITVVGVDDSLKRYDSEDYAFILASYTDYEAMLKKLEDVGMDKICICTAYSFFMAVMLNRNTALFPESFRNKLKTYHEMNTDIYVYNYMLRHLKLMQQAFENGQPLIYQAGKVGSTALTYSIKSLNVGITPVHLHTMAVPLSFVKSRSQDIEMFLETARKKTFKIITIVRNPFDRDISSFFSATAGKADPQQWPFVITYSIGGLLRGDFLNNGIVLNRQEIEKRIIEDRPCITEMCVEYMNEIIRYQCDEFSWFDCEIKPIFGIDIYDYPFDQEKGYGLIHQNNIDILLLKLEKMDNLNNIIAEFLGVSDVPIERMNESAKSVSRYVYRCTKDSIILDRKYVEFYMNSPKTAHFYSKKELEGFLTRFKVRRSE